jgi:hypothetical protein
MKKFYDIHCHAMNLSHPAFLPFIKTLKLDQYLFLNSIPLVSIIFSGIIENKLNAIKNLLSVMENDIGEFFLLMENDDILPMLQDGKFRSGQESYDKLVLTPLMIDFGVRQITQMPDIHYKIRSHKPITDQVIDLFNGIKKYKRQSKYQLFEIYPFLGLNTKNYDMQKTREDQTSLPELLEKYFSQFSADSMNERPQELFKQMGKFNGDVDQLGNFAFSGIKIYPPLGFDPWPDDPLEKEKVIFLYDFCLKKQIPITTHCSEGGFIIDQANFKYTDPACWQKVLEYDQGRFRELRLNFAHFGHQGRLFSGDQWFKLVLGLLKQYPNLYTDFSYRGVKSSYYTSLGKLIQQNPQIEKKILFGSDFMINLLDTDSYHDYLDAFIHTDQITSQQKDHFCSINPEKFLFNLDN